MTASTLAGRGIVVTRPEGARGSLARRLGRRGARVLRWPTVVIEPAADPEPFARALAELEPGGWLVFPSARAVAAAETLGIAARKGVRVAVAGDATARAARRAGWPVEVVPVRFGTEGLLRAARRRPPRSVLLAAAAATRPELGAGFAALGARVRTVALYRTVPAPLDAEACWRARQAGEVDGVTFASPSAVEGFCLSLGEDGAAFLRGLVVASIGPTTSAALCGHSLPLSCEPERRDLGGLVTALEDAFAARAARAR